MADDFILEMRSITKEFPGVRALDNVAFQVRRGEIHCLVGENGAGKSTLMKILSGVYPVGTFEGEIILTASLSNSAALVTAPCVGLRLSIRIGCLSELTIYENIFVGNKSPKVWL